MVVDRTLNLPAEVGRRAAIRLRIRIRIRIGIRVGIGIRIGVGVRVGVRVGILRPSASPGPRAAPGVFVAVIAGDGGGQSQQKGDAIHQLLEGGVSFVYHFDGQIAER